MRSEYELQVGKYSHISVVFLDNFHYTPRRHLLKCWGANCPHDACNFLSNDLVEVKEGGDPEEARTCAKC